MRPVEATPEEMDALVEYVYAETGAPDADAGEGRAAGATCCRPRTATPATTSTARARTTAPTSRAAERAKWVAAVIADAGHPLLFGDRNKMPKFRGKLTAEEIDQLATFVIGLKGEVGRGLRQISARPRGLCEARRRKVGGIFPAVSETSHAIVKSPSFLVAVLGRLRSSARVIVVRGRRQGSGRHGGARRRRQRRRRRAAATRRRPGRRRARPAVTLTVDGATTGRGLEPLLRGRGRDRSREHDPVVGVGPERAERAEEGPRPGRVPLRALPRHPEPRHRRLSGDAPALATDARLRLDALQSGVRRGHGGGHAPDRRDQLHAARAGVEHQRRSRRSSGTTACRRTSASRSADRTGATATGPTGSKFMADIVTPPRGALRRRRGARPLVLRGLERGDLDVRRPARPATTSSTTTPRSACWRAIRGQGGRSGRQRRQLAVRDPVR